MQAETVPPLSGQVVQRTAEKSVLKLLVEGHDDSDLASAEPRDKGTSRAQAAVLDQLIAQIDATAEPGWTRSALNERAGHLDHGIAQVTAAIDSLVEQRSDLVRRCVTTMDRLSTLRSRLSDLDTLSVRFGILREKYESDIARLEMVAEAGTLLGFFRPGVCVFCGADVEHQSQPAHAIEEITSFGASVSAEIEKTQSLRADLQSTIDALDQERAGVSSEVEEGESEYRATTVAVAALDDALTPSRLQLADLVEERRKVDHATSVLDQLQRVHELRAKVAPIPGPDQASARPSHSTAYGELATLIRETLVGWQLPQAELADFDSEHLDVLIDGQSRSARGKGMRAILHAAFSVALAEYCARADLPHPGFVVLDSPLVTYREPDGDVQAAEDAIGQRVGTVADAFFRALSGLSGTQVVVMENTDPPDLPEGSATVRFTKSIGVGRYGLYPPRDSGSQVA